MMQVQFPDTLYLPERARLAVQSLKSIVDPESGLPWCLFDVTSDPPHMEHTCFDWSDHTARTIDALLLGGVLSGEETTQCALELYERLKQGFHENGLHYTPNNPWTSEQANMHYQRSVINALLSLTLALDSQDARQRLEKLVAGLHAISIKREDFWYFPAVEYLRDGWFRGDWGILGYGIDPANTNGRLLFGLCRYYELSGDPKAAELAKMFVNHVMYHSSAYLPDGGFATGMEFREGHFHSRAVTMLGVIRYAYTFNDRDALTWGRRVFDKALTYGTRSGWFPERLVKERAHGCETCAVVDMMETAIWLAKSGLTEYWETAERILRNQLAGSQILSIQSLKQARKNAHAQEIDLSLLQPFVGGFSGWSEPNDILSKAMHRWDLYLCCCAQGVRGFFNVWNHVIERTQDGVRLNFLINYASQDVTVKSWLPDQGKLEIICADAGLLQVRLPSWIVRSSIRVCADGNELDWWNADGYLCVKVASIRPTSVIFEQQEETTNETVLETTYKMKWRGSSVIGITPRGTYIPLYEGREPESGMLNRMCPEKVGFFF